MGGTSIDPCSYTESGVVCRNTLKKLYSRYTLSLRCTLGKDGHSHCGDGEPEVSTVTTQGYCPDRHHEHSHFKDDRHVLHRNLRPSTSVIVTEVRSGLLTNTTIGPSSRNSDREIGRTVKTLDGL